MKLTKEDVSRILKLREEGVKVREIAKMFGISPRRVQQLIHEPVLKKPGRSRVEVPQKLKERIIALRREGHTIDRIHTILRSEGNNISRYKVWETIKSYEKKRIMQTLEQFKEKIDGEEVIYVDVIPLKRKSGILLRVVVFYNIYKNKVIHCEVTGSVKLRDIIHHIDLKVLKTHHNCFIVLSGASPLTPTRGCDNRLTRHLRNLGVSYVWLPEALKITCRRKVIKRIKETFETTLSCSEDLKKEVEKCFKEVCGVFINGNTGQDKGIFEDEDGRGDRGV